MKPAPLCAAAVLALAAAYAPQAAAETIQRASVSHGVANCQPALPVFDGLIRKRPKALANEGTSNAFVTCDFEQVPNVEASVERVAIFFVNRNNVTVTASCTLVQGLGDTDFAPAIVKSVQLAPGALMPLVWDAGDNGDINLTAPATSCNLRPGVEIAATQLFFLEGTAN